MLTVPESFTSPLITYIVLAFEKVVAVAVAPISTRLRAALPTAMPSIAKAMNRMLRIIQYVFVTVQI